MTHTQALPPHRLKRCCDPATFTFQSTADLSPPESTPGQERAIDALKFGIGIRQPGYNLYVLGPKGAGRHHLVMQYLQQQTRHQSTPSDWCYVNNFQHPHKPWAVQLPAGQAQAFRQDMAHLLEDLQSALPAAFEQEEYHTQLEEIEDELKSKAETAFEELNERAKTHQVRLLRTPQGFAFAPLKDGEVLNPKEYRQLPDKEQAKIEEVIAVLEEELNTILHQQPQWQRETREKIQTLNREVALFATRNLLRTYQEKYQAIPRILDYLTALQEDVIEHLSLFRGEEDNTGFGLMENQTSFRRYEINVLVDNNATQGMPLIYEDNPVYQNLLGRVEYKAQLGALTTDFTQIRPGALHLANGGYLILDAIKLLQQPFAWEGLKRVLSSRELRLQSLADLYSMISTVTLEPEPIPLDVKVVLVGDRIFYYLLQEYDHDFAELFKVEVDFEDEVDISGDNIQLYARFIAGLAKQSDLRPFDREAVAGIIEHSSRLAEDAAKLSTHTGSIIDLMREADYWAADNGHDQVTRADIRQAIDKQIYRADRIRSRFYEEIRRGTILIDTRGEKIAQINALSIMELGDFAFGQPSRITATARLGEGDVVDIEREVDMGGALHSKGVYILSAFLGARYADERPLSLNASLVFEQSYGGIDGDSASMAELCVLLSALAKIPLRQDLAITGSVNQLGEAQAIGGVNEKIEGFFAVCHQAGLTGKQGVLIPASNVQHLMLRDEVVQAAEQGRFHIYAYHNIDQAMELLTGLQAGELDAEGQYPADSINAIVENRLIELEDIREKIAKAAKDEDKDDTHEEDTKQT
ncbi:MAG: AAA family ATPase [Gammaproteobacteria bacterium]|nr:AAA family ATPase [Gammaproteobacteria bacterium]MDH5651612.1 AAA family ATPase [Gammaproteobacteria bacterium]